MVVDSRNPWVTVIEIKQAAEDLAAQQQEQHQQQEQQQQQQIEQQRGRGSGESRRGRGHGARPVDQPQQRPERSKNVRFV